MEMRRIRRLGASKDGGKIARGGIERKRKKERKEKKREREGGRGGGRETYSDIPVMRRHLVSSSMISSTNSTDA